MLNPLAGRASTELRALRDRLNRGLEALPLPDWLRPALGATHSVAAYRAARREAFETLDAAIDHVGDAVDFDLLRFLEGGTRLRAALRGGVGLAGFLRGPVERASGGVRVDVTGHSKGGALSIACAQWLADSQGDALDLASAWDPDRKSVVRCFSFAGPTPGNAAFAARVDSVLGARCPRVANALDPVPNAWAVRDADPQLCIERIPALYEPDQAPPAALRDLAPVVADDVRPLRYGHTGANTSALVAQ